MELKCRGMVEDDIKFIMQIEHQVYPISDTTQQITDSQLREWYIHNDQSLKLDSNSTLSINNKFAMMFTNDQNQTKALALILPLSKKGFNDLINDQKFEYELTPKTDFFRLQNYTVNEMSHDDPDSSRVTYIYDIGLHVFMVQKFDKSVKSFYRILLNQLNIALSQLKQDIERYHSIRHTKNDHSVTTSVNESNAEKSIVLNVIGLSSFAVSLEGLQLFENKLNMREFNHCVSNEYILFKFVEKGQNEKVKTLKWFKCNNQKDYTKMRDLMVKEDFKFQNRCRMLVTYKYDISKNNNMGSNFSIVWSFIKQTY